MSIQKVFVVGAGQMGGGIAQVMAAAGHTVYLNDIDMGIVQNRLKAIEKLLDKDLAKGRITQEQKDTTMGNLNASADLKDAADCDLVVEAILEKIEIKGKVFTQLDSICKPECILASNTSSLPITEIAAFTKRPDKVIGMHFMNPVPVMKLVEVIRGIATSDETFAAVKETSAKLNKTTVEVRDVPGFALNRILILMINEAAYCVYEGVASPEDTDTVMKLGANHPMGPLQLADLIGLDVVLAIMDTMCAGYADSKYRPCPLIRQYVKAGWLGRKTGRGFHQYG